MPATELAVQALDVDPRTWEMALRARRSCPKWDQGSDPRCFADDCRHFLAPGWTTRVAQGNSLYLRLYAEQADTPRPAVDDMARALADVCRSFEHATGWPLSYAAGSADVDDPLLAWSAEIGTAAGTPAGHLRLESNGDAPDATVSLSAAAMLASSIADLANQLAATRRALWQREAELATYLPMLPRVDEDAELARRLEGVLRGGARAIGCHAAALYLLDEATTELKLRACWGLPHQRFAEPARPLREAIADLEALAGHAVALESAAQSEYWNPPEPYDSAVCVPVSSATTPLGTLWVYCGREREFTDDEVNLVEIVAGRLAAELEREVLLAEGVQAAQARRELATAERWQQNQFPHVAPLDACWNVAGWSRQAGSVGGAFHDWFVRDDGGLVVTGGFCLNGGAEAALAAAATRTALRSHGQYVDNPAELLERVNRAIWNASSGDQWASICCLMADADGARLWMSGAGVWLTLVGHGAAWKPQETNHIQLGVDPNAQFDLLEQYLTPGGVLLAVPRPALAWPSSPGAPISPAALIEAFADRQIATAAHGVELVRDRLEAHTGRGWPADVALLSVGRNAARGH